MLKLKKHGDNVWHVYIISHFVIIYENNSVC